MNKPGTDTEKKYDVVYGGTFALYGKKDMDEFIHPFQVRFDRNNLDPKSIFAGKRCLDAGCGNGRGTLFMLKHGAAQVTSLDVSPSNIESTQRFVKEFGFSGVETRLATLEEIPFADETFDFVWCNGVIMHTAHPNRCLAELSRVLKTGGKSWIYIYGSGGIYWRIIQHFRQHMKGISAEQTTAYLRLLRYEPRYIGEFIDDWYASHLRCYTHSDLSKRLKAVGFKDPDLLTRAVDYDTSERRHLYKEDIQLDYMGEGDLRYLLEKSGAADAEANLLDEGEYGSNYEWPKSVTDVVDLPVDALAKATAHSPYLRISAFAFVQRELRLLLTETAPFDPEKLTAIFDNVHEMIRLASRS